MVKVDRTAAVGCVVGSVPPPPPAPPAASPPMASPVFTPTAAGSRDGRAPCRPHPFSGCARRAPRLRARTPPFFSRPPSPLAAAPAAGGLTPLRGPASATGRGRRWLPRARLRRLSRQQRGGASVALAAAQGWTHKNSRSDGMADGAAARGREALADRVDVLVVQGGARARPAPPPGRQWPPPPGSPRPTGEPAADPPRRAVRLGRALSTRTGGGGVPGGGAAEQEGGRCGGPPRGAPPPTA